MLIDLFALAEPRRKERGKINYSVVGPQKKKKKEKFCRTFLPWKDRPRPQFEVGEKKEVAWGVC